MNIAQSIAEARALLETAERETDPERKAHALEEALGLLDAIEPEETAEAERTLIANLRMAHTRRLLVQLVGFKSVSMDAWFEYAHLLFGQLRPEVDRLIAADPELNANYAGFIELWGPELAGMLRGALEFRARRV